MFDDDVPFWFAILTAIVFAAIYVLVFAWPVMLIVGGLHHTDTMSWLPALSYGQCAGVLGIAATIVLPLKLF
jgi:hypothetical protein